MSKLSLKGKLRRNSQLNVPSYLPDLNRSELAKKVGVDRAHISRVFSGQVIPGMPLMRKLSRALGISVGKLDKVLEEIQTQRAVKQNAIVR
jgi:transcriptional regulator with XRE-family HTH domain